MANDYFDGDNYTALTRDTLARAEAINTILSAIVAGFDAVPVYATGTFTPTIRGSSVAGTQTYLFQVGHYTRIGNICHIRGHVETSGSLDAATAGNIQIGGLPFAAVAGPSGEEASIAIGRISGLENKASGTSFYTLRIIQAEQVIRLMEFGATAGNSGHAGVSTAGSNGLVITFGGAYRIA